jgi:hypothetical protein
LITNHSVLNSHVIASLSSSITDQWDNMINFSHDEVTTIVVDNSATGHVINDSKYFIEDIEPAPHTHVATIGKHTHKPVGKAAAQITFKDDDGITHTIILKNAYYFPDSPVNVLSVTAFADQLDDDDGTWIQTCRHKSVFQWDHGKYQRQFYHPLSGLPELPLISSDISSSPVVDEFLLFIHSFNSMISPFWVNSFKTRFMKDDHRYRVLHFDPDEDGHDDMFNPSSVKDSNEPKDKLDPQKSSHLSSSFSDMEGSTSLAGGAFSVENNFEKKDDVSMNSAEIQRLYDLQDEFLLWHEKLNHISYSKMMNLAQHGFLPKKFLKLRSSLPPCGVCLFGQAKKRSWRTKAHPRTIRDEKDTKPGAGTSVDQLISHQPGLIPQSAGLLMNDKITAVTFFVDHFSGYVYGHLMCNTSMKHTLEAKQAYERHAKLHGVDITRYRADNGQFSNPEFLQAVEASDQEITFCAVGGHHQNGIAEKKIGDVTSLARTILQHARRNWPEVISIALWPFAIKYAMMLTNTLCMDKDGNTPLSKFTKISVNASNLDLNSFHTFGFPCYVLDPRLQSGTIGPPKWDPRSQLWIFVGFSPLHSRTVAMVLNPNTGLVSPQFHVVFDDHFRTLKFLRSDTTPQFWSDLCHSLDADSTDFDLHPATTVPMDLEQESSRQGGDSIADGIVHGEVSEHNHDPANTEDGPSPGGAIIPADDEITASEKQSQTQLPFTYDRDFINLETAGLRRSRRVAKLSNKAKSSSLNFKRILGSFAAAFVTIGILYSSSFPSPMCLYTRTVEHSLAMSQLIDNTFNSIPIFSLAAHMEQNEVYTYKEAMKQEDAKDFIKAMLKEIEDHESRGHWTMMKRSNMPINAKTILSIWSFKRKRHPDGSLNKHKARICAHGGMQKWGVDYWETYSPVVNWISVRALLAISTIHNLPTKSIDFVLAFPQADLDTDVFMEIPAGFSRELKSTHVLKLNKSLYGLKQASSNWYKHLTSALLNRQLTQSNNDKCVFFKEGLIVLVYVDDCIIVGKSDSHISNFIESLRSGKEKFDFTEEGNLEQYLGVDIKKLNKNSFEMRQPFLIEKILNVFENDDSNPRKVPALKDPLHKDEEGPPRKYSWNYRSVIGMLNYLQGSTRPDISMAVHQCARFTSNPKLSHERAILYLSRYLKGTSKRGIIFDPDTSRGIECFVDASFAPGWKPEVSNDPANVLSRTGFVIMYAGCPVYWCSKMQTEIALSTAESEYIALSQAMRELIPFIHLPRPEVYCKVFEDNESCIKMTKSEKYTPRTKHIALKYHHFRSFVDKNIIRI